MNRYDILIGKKGGEPRPAKKQEPTPTRLQVEGIECRIKIRNGPIVYSGSIFNFYSQGQCLTQSKPIFSLGLNMRESVSGEPITTQTFYNKTIDLMYVIEGVIHEFLLYVTDISMGTNNNETVMTLGGTITK